MRRSTAEDLADARVFVVLQPELGGRLLVLRRRDSVVDGVQHLRGDERGENRREGTETVGGRAGQRVDRVLRGWHQTDDVAGLVANACDVPDAAIRIAADVTRDDEPRGVELLGVADVATLAVLDRDND